jgi:hypothetical protein
MDYVFRSIDRYRFHCKVNTIGDWYIKEVIGRYCVPLIDENDYITVNNVEIRCMDVFFNLSDFIDWFNDTVEGIDLFLDHGNRLVFKSTNEIIIQKYSYNYQKLFNLKQPSVRSEQLGNKHKIICYPSIGIWYFISTCGSNCMVNTMDRDYYCGLCLKTTIHWKVNDQILIRNTEYKNKLVGNIIDIQIVDENFIPIQNESDLIITIHIDQTENIIPYSSELIKQNTRSLPHMIRKTNYELPTEDKIIMPPLMIQPMKVGKMIFPCDNETIEQNEKNECLLIEENHHEVQSQHHLEDLQDQVQPLQVQYQMQNHITDDTPDTMV